MKTTRTVYRLTLAATQWRNEYDEFKGLRKDGKPCKKTHHPAGPYFIGWRTIGDFTTKEEAETAAHRLHKDDPMQYEFMISKVEITEQETGRASYWIAKEVAK